ncbi:hypothetical protein AHAS_Ahas16G0054900 [Arachis hypogaea]
MPVGEVTMTWEDMLYISGQPIDATIVTDNSHDFLVTQSLAIFSSETVMSSSSKRYVKL